MYQDSFPRQKPCVYVTTCTDSVLRPHLLLPPSPRLLHSPSHSTMNVSRLSVHLVSLTRSSRAGPHPRVSRWPCRPACLALPCLPVSSLCTVPVQPTAPIPRASHHAQFPHTRITGLLKRRRSGIIQVQRGWLGREAGVSTRCN